MTKTEFRIIDPLIVNGIVGASHTASKHVWCEKSGRIARILLVNRLQPTRLVGARTKFISGLRPVIRPTSQQLTTAFRGQLQDDWQAPTIKTPILPCQETRLPLCRLLGLTLLKRLLFPLTFEVGFQLWVSGSRSFDLEVPALVFIHWVRRLG